MRTSRLVQRCMQKPGLQMKKGVCVCFIGIDGCGKTSNAKNLSRNLAMMGVDSFCLRPEYLLLNCLPESLIRWVSKNVFAGSKMTISKTEKYVGNRKKRAKSVVLKTILNVGFVFYAWLMHELVVKSRLNRYVVIYDRYFYDWIFYLNSNKFDSLVQLVPKPDLVFLLDVEISEAFRRMQCEADKEFPHGYYLSLRGWYLTLAKHDGFVVVDCAQNLSQTSCAILDHTLQSLERQ